MTPRGGGVPLDDGVDLDTAWDTDLDLAPEPQPSGGPGAPASRSGDGPAGRRRRLRRALVVTAAAVAATAVVVTSLDRHQERAAALARTDAAADAAADGSADGGGDVREGDPMTAWQVQQQRAAAHYAREVAALALLPEDVADEQHFVREALSGAAPRLVDLDWSTARTETRRDDAQRTAQGDPKLVDAARFARVSDEGGDDGGAGGGATEQPLSVPVAPGELVVVPASGAGPAPGVGWRITTPLQRQDLGDVCAVAGALPLPEEVAGVAPPACRLQTFTSASGEQQVVAVRTWEQLVDSPGAASPARVEVVQQAVLVTDGRWAWSVAASAVGRPGTRAAVPPMSVDQVVLATRWLADTARGLPTPAPLDGTPLPGFSE